MTKKKRLPALLAAFGLAAAVLAGCGSAGDALAGKLTERIAVENCAVENGTQLTATVAMPDYSAYMDGCFEEAARTAKNESDFEKKLYTLVLEAADGADADCTREVTLDLSALDADKAAADWTQAELDSAAKKAAFDAEVEEFCFALLAESYPADFAPGEAESEARAE